MSDFTDFLKSDEGLSLLAGLTQTVASARGRKAGQEDILAEASKQEDLGKKMYERMLAELRSGKYDVAQSQRDLVADQKIAAEAFEEAVRQRGQEKRGDVVSAIHTGDARLTHIAPIQAREIESGIQEAELKGLQLKANADATVANLEQDALERQGILTERIMDRSGLGVEEGRRARLQAMLNIKQAWPASIQEGIQTGIAAYGALKEEDPKNPARNHDGTADVDGNPETGDSKASGGKIEFEEGGDVMVTEGEFDHDTNKKALIDEESGEKEGELTGGELVFNPEQADTMENLVNKDDGEGLIAYLKDLFSQPHFAK